jgi:hypothetical protein
MKTPLKTLGLIIALTAVSFISFGQTAYHSTALDIRLNGTSNIHDWEMKALAGKGDATFVVNAGGQVTGLTALNFTLPAVNLKSEHSQMDKNTYKALKTDRNPNITFALTSADVTATGGNNYQLKCVGKLAIAGTVKHTDLIATAKYNPADKSLTVTGIKKMKMTDYNVDPPKALMGTIKTGDAIAISFNMKFTK